MATSMSFFFLLSLLAFVPLCLCQEGNLYPQFYDNSCPQAPRIVRSILATYLKGQPRLAASILRLHFHDCFVKGCDASLLLDSSESITSEKESNPNRNSARGFEVIDAIKNALERECPSTVSCADILTLAARDSVVLSGGPSWEVPLGRRDSRDASINGSNNDIPAPTNTFQTILTKFQLQGLDLVDVVALSGAHTIGNARCTSFRERLYSQNSSNGEPDSALDPYYAAALRFRCPRSGGDQNLFFLDYVTPYKFDNYYFKNIVANKGLLSSDQILLANQESAELVNSYAENNDIFFEQFAKSMIKMGNISPLTNSRGEIRKNCRQINA